MIDANAIVESLLDDESPDPKEFVGQHFEPTFGTEEQNTAAEQAARCIYLWLVQDFGDYENPEDFTDELAHSVADVVTDGLKIGNSAAMGRAHDNFMRDADTAAQALRKTFAGKDLGEIVMVPKLAWDLSKQAANDSVAAFMHKAPDNISYKLRRLRHRRGEM
jgi:hypothetical protein